MEQNATDERLAVEGQEQCGAPALQDQRDMRDPQELGRTLIQVKTYYSTRTLSQVADLESDVLARVPDYDPNPPDHAATRLRELEDRAAQGDRFAAAVLRGDTLAEDPVD